MRKFGFTMRQVMFSLLVLLPIAAGNARSYAQRGPALVEVTPVVEREVSSGQTFVGTISPPRRAVIGSAVDGRVVSVLVEEGDRVEQGQALAELLTNTIQLELEAAEAELELRQQQLTEMENGSLPTEIEQARARMERARANSEFRQNEFQRISLLSQRNATSESELDAARTAALETQEAFDEAKAAYQLAVDGPRRERIAQAKAQVAMQDAIVRRLEDRINKYTITSRFAGYVTVKSTDLGEWVTEGDPIAEVIELDQVDVITKVVENQVRFIEQGDSVRVEIPAVPDRSFIGTVVAVVPQADVRSRTFPVKVRIKNEIESSGEPLIKAGMLAQVTLATGAVTQAKLVPKDALVLGGPQPMVWIVNPSTASPADGGKQIGGAVAVPVHLGIADGQLIQVDGDVPVGSLVVYEGNERIVPDRSGKPSPVTWIPRSRNAGNADARREGS